jgi:uncharacterized protein YdeI (YjbR/CyaY-like superfamily)
VVAHADKPVLALTSADEWERWLESSADPGGVRLRLRKKGSTKPGITYSDALEVALCHGWIDGQAQSDSEDFYLQAFTPRRARSPWSQINCERAERLLATGRMRPAGQAEIDRAKADGRWDAAYRLRDAVVPPDLQLALDASPTAAAAFARLSSQNRFAILFRIGNVKRPATRARKIGEYVAMLERGETIYPQKATQP